MYIEVKKPDGVLSELQKVRLKELKLQGIKAVVWIDYKKEFKDGLY